MPDTITSWVISAFSLSPSKGLGLTSKTSKVTVFKSFFVSLNLPYSVKRGEVVAVPIVVFNYLDTVQSAEVTLHNVDNEFEFVELSNDIDGTASESKPAFASINDCKSIIIFFLEQPPTNSVPRPSTSSQTTPPAHRS